MKFFGSPKGGVRVDGHSTNQEVYSQDMANTIGLFLNAQEKDLLRPNLCQLQFCWVVALLNHKA